MLMIVFVALHLTYALIGPKLSENPEDLATWEWFFKIILMDMGLQSLMYVSLAISVILLVFREVKSNFLDALSASAESEIQRNFMMIAAEISSGFSKVADSLAGATGKFGADTTLSLLKGGNLSEQELEDIGLLALRRCLREEGDLSGSYLYFIFNEFLKKTLVKDGLWRKNLFINISIKKDNALGSEKNYFWNEVKTYDLYCPQKKGQHRIGTFFELLADPRRVREVLQNYELSVKADNLSLFSYRGVRDAINIDTICNGGEYRGNGLEISYKNSILKLRYYFELTISKLETRVIVSEKNIVNRRENVYTFLTSRPVQGMRVDFGVPDDWSITEVTVAPEFYSADAKDLASIHGWPEKSDNVNVSATGWVLPGIPVIIRYEPRERGDDHASIRP